MSIWGMQLPALLQAQKVVSAEDGEGFSFQLGKWCGTVERGRLPLSLWIVTVPGQHVVVGQKRQLLWALWSPALTREGSGPFMDAMHRESLHVELLFGFLPADT